MNWIVFTAVSGLSLAAGATAIMARKHAWRWGRVPTGTASVGDGPYRKSELSEYRERGVPAGVKAASLMSIVWGLLTALVFAPAGLLFCLVAVDISIVGTLAVLVVSIHGFCLTGRLFAASGAVMRRATDDVLLTARASMYHHLAVIAIFAFMCIRAGVAGHFEPALLVLATIPSLIGMALARQLEAAARADSGNRM